MSDTNGNGKKSLKQVGPDPVANLPVIEGFPASEDYDEKWSEYGAWEMFTSPFNVTGQPAISLPCRARSSSGAPIGVQLVGRLGGEAELLTLGAAYEAVVGWTPHPPESMLFETGSS